MNTNFKAAIALAALLALGCTKKHYSPDPPWDGYPVEATGYVDYGSADYEEIPNDLRFNNENKDEN